MLINSHTVKVSAEPAVKSPDFSQGVKLTEALILTFASLVTSSLDPLALIKPYSVCVCVCVCVRACVRACVRERERGRGRERERETETETETDRDRQTDWA